MSDTESPYDLVGDAGWLDKRINALAAAVFGDDLNAVDLALAQLEEPIASELDKT